MTIAFHSLNYPSHGFGYMNKIRGQHGRSGTSPALVISQSSILLQNDAINKRSPEGGSLLNQDNTIGIVGGVSANSTLKFLKKLVNWSGEDGKNCPPFVLCSDPMLGKELLSRERSSSMGKNEGFCMEKRTIVEDLRRKRAFLEKSGARCIVMPCNVSHSWYDEVSRGSSVSFLHIGDCVAKELKEAKLRPVETGSPLRIGVLATEATMTAGFYQKRLQNEGFEAVLPDKATMEHTVIPAIEALNRNDLEGARTLFRIALQLLLVRAVNTVILASDDIRDLLPPDDPLLKKCIDPMDALVRSTIKWSQSVKKSK